MSDVFDTAALRQASEMPWPTDFKEQSRLWAQNSSDLSAAADYIDEILSELERLLADQAGVR